MFPAGEAGAAGEGLLIIGGHKLESMSESLMSFVSNPAENIVFI